MGDIRKPVFVFLLRNTSKKKSDKLEIFKGTDWDKYERSKYRLRVNGKWYPKGEIRLFYKSEIREILFKSINF